MTHYIEHAIAIKEIAAVAKRTTSEVEAEARELDMHVGQDWAGRAAVEEQDAQQLVSGEARRTREHDALWRTYIDECSAWEADRDEAVRAAHAAVGANPRSGPERHAQARDAAAEAGRAYEQANPPPTFQDGADSAAVRRYTERPPEPGLLRRAVDAVKAGGAR